MIDLHDGHIAVAVSLLEALASNGPWTLGGRRPAGPQSRTATRFPSLTKAPHAGGGRLVDVKAPRRRYQSYQKGLISSDFSKPSDGLEPSTPSLPSMGRRSRASHLVFVDPCGFDALVDVFLERP